MMKPIVLAGYDDEDTKIPFVIPVKGGKPVTVEVPRFDYIPEDRFDKIMTELEDLDAEQQVIAVANDLKDLDPGSEVIWEPLIESARATLTKLGVSVARTVKQGRTQEKISAPDAAVIEALKPYSSQPPQSLRKRSRSIALAMLSHVVTAEQLALFEALPSGALDKMLAQWREQSTITLGESAASS